jgi:hypothetical protein
VREALETVATPEVAGRMLFEALAEARLAGLPEAHEDLRAFADAELSQTVLETLGADAVTVVRERIELVLRVLSQVDLHTKKRQSVRPPSKTPVAMPAADVRETRRPPPRPARDDATRELPSGELALERSGPHVAPPAPRTEWKTAPPLASAHASSGHRIVVVTADPRLGSELRVRLGAGATVLTYRTPAELARSPVGAAKVLVLDVRELARDAEVTSRAAKVLLWPASASVRARFAAKHPALHDVRSAGEDASVEDLAALILQSV